MKPAGKSRHSLALTITIALVVKMLLLALLWKAFFSKPQTNDNMLLPASQVEQHLFAASPPSTTLKKLNHESR